MADKLRWGILSTGRIAHLFTRGVAASRSCAFVAVASRSQDKADKFAAEFADRFPNAAAYGSYEALLADNNVDAVYIATPHPMHAEWAIKTARAGKHVLVEKPIGMNFPEAMAVIEAARENDVFLMEAFMYRCHPLTAKLVELVKSGAIGQVRAIQGTYSYNAEWNPAGRIYSNALGGGGILDIGCYPVSVSRLVAGAAAGKDFADPDEVVALGHLGQTGVDEWAAAILKFPGDIIAQVAAGVAVGQDNSVRVYGTLGRIIAPSIWRAPMEGGTAKLTLALDGKEPQEIEVTTPEWLWGIEADTVAANISRRQAPAMSWADTLGNMRTLDRWRAGIGLVYDAEKPEAQIHTVDRAKLAVRKDMKIKMKYGNIPGVDKPVSRLIMGADNQPGIAHASVMFDDFFSRGGNCFDTAYVYAGGRAERQLGWWVKNRGIRKDVVVLDKGAHTPCCTPEFLTRQFRESLERLQMDYVDIYLMHRDNTDVPVGEFIDVLNEHKQAGLMRSFGVSNWTLERVKAANAYARAKGVAGIAAVSNNLSLADMIDAVWGSCLSSKGPDWTAFFKETGVASLPWSSQARGFFTDRARRDGPADEEISRCWYSEDNWKRRDRAAQLAEKRGVSLINIALAWVLSQPFETFPLIGPRTIEETRTSWPALSIELSEREVKWLNLETDKP